MSSACGRKDRKSLLGPSKGDLVSQEKAEAGRSRPGRPSAPALLQVGAVLIHLAFPMLSPLLREFLVATRLQGSRDLCPNQIPGHPEED